MPQRFGIHPGTIHYSVDYEGACMQNEINAIIWWQLGE